MKKSFKNYLDSYKAEREVQQLLKAYGNLESYYEIELNEIIDNQKELQLLRKEIYMDTSLTPKDRRVFPEVIKSYYTYVTEEALPRHKVLTKGQSAKKLDFA